MVIVSVRMSVMMSHHGGCATIVSVENRQT